MSQDKLSDPDFWFLYSLLTASYGLFILIYQHIISGQFTEVENILVLALSALLMGLVTQVTETKNND